MNFLNFEKVWIVGEIKEKIMHSIKAGLHGVLVCWKHREKMVITGCVYYEVVDDIEQLSACLPEGMYICGTFSDEENHENITSEASYIHLFINIQGALTCLLDNAKLATLQDLTCDEAVEMLKDNTVLFQIRGIVMVNVFVKGNIATFDEAHAISEQTAFHIPSSNLILSSETTSDRRCKDLLQKPKTSATNLPTKIERAFKCTQVSILKCITTSNKSKAPQIRYRGVVEHVYKVPVPFNALCYISNDTPFKSIPEYMRIALLRQLHLVKTTLTDCHDISAVKMPIPEYFHFLLPGWCHPISLCYPANQNDTVLHSYRRNFLHPMFFEPATKPLFRRANGCFLYPPPERPYLLNPHFGVKDPDLEGGKVFSVTGSYYYHHYLQDKYDDVGWGCAYRSLQTIVSWYRLQGFTEKEAPTHRDIQKILVDIGDKPKSFYGTKKWIGSIEVSNVLIKYLGLSSKIMFVNRGSDLATRGRELAIHFKKQGTPIMIGGGVLAHTILGVCFSELLGDTKFLVLDPHYIGPEDLKTIIDKGWCGWKDATFWDQSAYYNICLPQKPEVV